MYWLKRPYQCDSRRIPQEWNISYDLERRISVSSQNFDAPESDFSSFSENENMSDQELDLVDRPSMNKEKCFKLSTNNKTPKEGTRKSSDVNIKSSPDSQRAIRYSVSGYAAQDAQKSDSTLPPRRSAQIMSHVSQSSVPLAQFQEFMPQRCYDTPSVATPVQDNGIIIRNKQWLPEENAKHPDPSQHTADSSCNSRHPLVLLRKRHKAADVAGAAAALSPAGAQSSSDRDAYVLKESDPCESNDGGNHACDSDSENNEINITSDDDRDVPELRGKRERGAALNKQQRELGSVISKPHSSSAVEECACYICGSKLSPTNQFRVYVQKQERTINEPFFPFLWLHNPPPGAVPLSPGGCTLVCACCHSSLMQQWQGFELANVPVLQRLYVVPLNMDPVGQEPHTLQSHKPEPEPTREACFLCGQDCGKDVKVAYAKAGPGKARSAMHFPFINFLPCPPNARGVKNGKVHCCKLCHGILEDIWAAYRLCLSEELITSVNTFLGRYHQAVSGGPNSQSGCLGLPPAHVGHTSMCYLCGTELGAGVEFQLNVNPPGRCGEGEPFFPFLTVHPPAPRAKPADSTGLVSTCVLCYHDLLGQWAQHESRSGQPASSPWSRQYSCDTFVCFFCRQEKRRWSTTLLWWMMGKN
ncbi:uncharacterized protein LOC118782295 [Megalops cyprinoides]|uniref:uncharacterized protein LOC118782295 n=1 Tax=Megalops cyprinoides TaxID=118141 RepID=UPI0018646BFB|nr:uncharacterized protein LOC118782295 [Megalops cyprinoides]